MTPMQALAMVAGMTAISIHKGYDLDGKLAIKPRLIKRQGAFDAIYRLHQKP